MLHCLLLNVLCVLTLPDQNDAEPVTVDFQDGFVYPYFRLTRAALIDLELILPDLEGEIARPPVVHYFDPALDTWVKMKVDSVIELTEPSQKLFFKGLHVTSYPRFNQLCNPTASREPNVRLSLSQERCYVKQTQTYTKARILDPMDALLELSSDEGCNDLLSQAAFSPKKRCTESNRPQQAPAMLHCGPTHSHDLQSRHALSDSGTHYFAITHILSTNAYSLQTMLFLFTTMIVLSPSSP